jgi:hypothetical protein
MTEQTEDFEGFFLTEFKCKCGCDRGRVDKRLAQLLVKTRQILRQWNPEAKVTINSGFRCPEHNAAIGGSAHSAHPLGEAGDLKAVEHAYRLALLTAVILAGFKRIEVCKTWIHVDVADDKLHPVPWVGVG